MISRDEIREFMNLILSRAGNPTVDEEALTLREIGFKSLDFAELALRVERRIGCEINFEGARLRAIVTVADALEFFEMAGRSD